MNQHPEQIAWDKNDEQLQKAGWVVQDVKDINPLVGLGIAVNILPYRAHPPEKYFKKAGCS